MDQFKAFVSENELAANRKQRQVEWDKVRKPDDPEEAPEEEYDPRSLFERLQQQKMKVQAEFEESRRLKNLIAVLDEDETSFLEMVDKTKLDHEKRQTQEEKEALQEFRKAIEGLTKDEQVRKIADFKISFATKGNIKKSKKTQGNPLLNLIKLRKSDDPKKSNDSSTESPCDKQTVDHGSAKKKDDELEPEGDKCDEKDQKVTLHEHKDGSNLSSSQEQPPTTKTCLVAYGSDSDDSEAEDSDNNIVNHPNKKAKTTM
ncbi:protein FAM192A-like [Tetranychus urticae]|uniref:FAM192A/Fyv6 N-terminal domain-containing protein n=1 Tax=Tetranychus urticae TaxID=32264 RepID=T1KQU2_TETUR|nr:protein FAM192A-like [Tetranychus urticae]